MLDFGTQRWQRALRTRRRGVEREDREGLEVLSWWVTEFLHVIGRCSIKNMREPSDRLNA